MGRRYTVKDVESLAAKAQELMPTIALGCDLMTGFPGETEMDFFATQGLLKRIAFSNAHIFPFSKRPGTVAAGLPDTVPKEVSHARAHKLADIAFDNRYKFAKKFLGKMVEIVCANDAAAMSPQTLKAMFDRFSRGDPARNAQQGGKPHPEEGTGTADSDCRCNADDVSRSDCCGNVRAECLE